jgi:ubiquitin carboxyl-terminal hydrolase L3
MSKKWFPLESNPAVMNSYCERMGLKIDCFSFQDVFSTEEWALSMIAQPVLGVLMLFPIKEESEQYADEESTRIEENGQVVSVNVYYMKQYVGNACGTVGILHAIGNAKNRLLIEPNSYLENFFNVTSTMSPDDIAAYLENDREIELTHEAAAAEGQSDQDIDVNNHFVCFRFFSFQKFFFIALLLHCCI